MARGEYQPKPRDEVRRNMSAIRSRENRTELALRRALHGRGLRYRKYRHDLPGRPDIVFPRARVAVFVDGDYWHCRFYIEGGEEALEAKLRPLPADRQSYWREKFTRRAVRDRSVTAALESDGWLVLRYWESDVKTNLAACVDQVVQHVQARVART